MKAAKAEKLIRIILKSIDTDELPKPSKVEEQADGKTLVWFGGLGRELGSALRGRWREPRIYRDDAIRTAFELEAVYRLDKQHLTTETSN